MQAHVLAILSGAGIASRQGTCAGRGMRTTASQRCETGSSALLSNVLFTMHVGCGCEECRSDDVCRWQVNASRENVSWQNSAHAQNDCYLQQILIFQIQPCRLVRADANPPPAVLRRRIAPSMLLPGPPHRRLRLRPTLIPMRTLFLSLAPPRRPRTLRRRKQSTNVKRKQHVARKSSDWM